MKLIKYFVIIGTLLCLLTISPAYAINIDHPDLTEEDALIPGRPGATSRNGEFELDHEEIETERNNTLIYILSGTGLIFVISGSVLMILKRKN